jgi:hypothetical protein
MGTVLRAAFSCYWVDAVSGRTVRALGVELQECLLWLCRRTALHIASDRGHTATAMALANVETHAVLHCLEYYWYGQGLHPRSSFGHCSVECRIVRPVGLALQACRCGCAAILPCCTWLHATAAQRRRWRWSRRARTYTARTTMGTDLEAGSRSHWFATVSGRTVRPLGAEPQECLFWLCRYTALHNASVNGHTETAMALVKAGADVRCKNNDGYGSRGRI